MGVWMLRGGIGSRFRKVSLRFLFSLSFFFFLSSLSLVFSWAGSEAGLRLEKEKGKEGK